MGGAARLVTYAVFAVSCRESELHEAKVEHRARIVVPLAWEGETCWDVGNVSACYDANSKARFVERAVPNYPARSKMGWRCTGQASKRSCRDRGDDAAEFRCQGDVCAQPHARVPDAHEWTCSDAAGASLCLSKSHATGVVSKPLEPGFVCGVRRAGEATGEERVCLDLSPDFPDGKARGWNCHFRHETGVTRVCRREPQPAVGDPCRPKHPTCPLGASCVGGHCLPPQPAPSCWLDRDCESKRCRFGQCIAG